MSRSDSFDPFSRRVLEFDGVVELLRGYLSGPLSAPLLDALQPHTDLERIQRDLERAREAREALRESARPRLGSLIDPRPLLEKLRVEGVALEALEIRALVEVARAARDLRRLFAGTPFTRLDSLAQALADFRDLVSELEGKILPDGSLDSSASPELARIRRSMERLRHEIQASLERLLSRLSQDGVLQDAVVTLRNERFVIPVRAEAKRRVPGVVHGASSSGLTVFVEPMETVPLNNELVELQDREFAEVQRLLAEFSRTLQARRDDLLAATAILSDLDLAYAKAEFAQQYDCCIPEFARERALGLKGVRHPLLERALRGQGRKAVPLTFELRAPHRMMVISGPNTGGKTVALKTLGTAVLMAQAGLPVPAGEARLPVFGRVLADIGDQQSIEANLSTFSAHVTNIQRMAAAADEHDLVLLDEIGSSTEPNEGAALAVAILEHFRRRGAMTLATTHHSRLKAYASECAEAVNAATEFDEATLQPTFRLLIGLPGKSSAFDIAQRLGLEPEIVAKARSLLSPGDAEAAGLLAELHRQRAELEARRALLEDEHRKLQERRAKLEREFEVERRARLRELDARLEGTLKHASRDWEKSLEELRVQAASAKTLGKGARQAAALQRETREEWNAQVLEALGSPAAPEEQAQAKPVAVGDPVHVVNVSTPGTVVSLTNDGQVEVEVGRLRLRVRQDEVRVLAAPAAPGPSPRTTLSEIPQVPAELNVIGQTAEEARETVDRFLDQAFVSGRFRLRIIHGHGKGILRKTLHEMFAAHPHVEKFYLAPPQEGGTGATIVELKL